jgi:uncharacterized membrane protein
MAVTEHRAVSPGEPDAPPASYRAAWIASGLTLVGMLALSLWAWSQVPEGQPIPVHWGPDGRPDRFGSRFEGLFTFPIATALTAALLGVVPRFEPRGLHLVQSRKAYVALWIAIVLFLGAIHAALALTAAGWPVDIARIVPVGVGVLFLVVGNYLGKLRSNFTAGIRTPWTLSSELSWNETHRAAGRLFVGLGLLLMACGLAGSLRAMLVVVFGGTLPGIGFLLVYSYLVWKRDPERETRGA